jgi:NAD(P)H-dependent FMN reductase
MRIAVVLGSTRPGRVGESVAQWVLEKAQARGDAEYELVDVARFALPLLDEPIPPSQNRYTKPHTRAWAAKIASFDGFVFVTGEYNHGVPAAIKNAIDYLYVEWTNKAAGFVSYGSAGGVRAVEQLRQVMAELQVADVRATVPLTLSLDFANYREFRPRPGAEGQLKALLDQVLAWAGALRSLRTTAERTQ